ncbi:MAG: hypothetical protein M1818_001180 [Claussenomyces sp. TS43310]|nr:MAG: hypothetical protein M1818_001180 [Claussenomyces sp. TS43310]
MTSRTERFERKAASPRPAPKEEKEEGEEEEEEEEEKFLRFEPEREATLLAESNEHKTRANTLFAAQNYDEAIAGYNDALESCPRYLSYERAVIKSNVAACYLHTSAWKDAVKVATEALDLLDPKPKKRRRGKDGEEVVGPEDGKGDEDGAEKSKEDEEEQEEEADEEIVSHGAQNAEKTPATMTAKEKRKQDVDRIRTKALLRRAKARSELGGWSMLQGAEEDYKLLSTVPNLSASDRQLVQRQLLLLPPRTKAAQETEMGEMMGKLKQLGNGILKPFGLSTDHFQMVKDEKTGGYSMNFNQGGGR